MENSSIINFKPKSFSKRLLRNVTPLVYPQAIFGANDELENNAAPSNEIIATALSANNNRFYEEETNVSCIYCHENNLNYLVRCDVCKNHFCNSGIKSHFYEHLRFCQHHKFSLLNFEYNQDSLQINADKQKGLKHFESYSGKNFKRSPIRCTVCKHSMIYDLIYIMIDRSDKELIDLRNIEEADKISSMLNVEKKIVFVCDPKYRKACFKECQSSIFEGLEVDDDYYKNVINAGHYIDSYLVKTKLQFKNNNNKRSKECNFSDILMVEKRRLHMLKIKYLKKNDTYNIMTDYEIENNHGLLIDELSILEDTESSEDEMMSKDKVTENDKEFLKSPLLDEEKQLFTDKTKSLKRMYENSRNFIFSNFEEFLIFSGKLLYKEQFDMLALTASPSTQLANNMIFVPYKKISFFATSINEDITKDNGNTQQEESEYCKSIKDSIFTDSEIDVAIRLNTNYNLPKLKIGQILGLEYCKSKGEEDKKSGEIDERILGFAVVKQVPGNSFNPELKLKMLPFRRINNTHESEDQLEDFCGRYFTNESFGKRNSNKGKTTKKFLDSFEITSYSKFNILPFDHLLSTILTSMFKIILREIELDNFLMNLILGKKFENFEFNLNQRKNNSNMGFDYVPGINLNLQQNRALDNIDTNKVTVVKGGFGTGKTTVAFEMIEKLISKKMTPILVCSSNNLVVDDLCEKFNMLSEKKDKDYLISRIVAPLKEEQYNINHKIADLCFHNFLLFNAPEELISLNIKKKMNQLSLVNKARLAKFYREYFQQQDVIFSTSYTSADDRLNGVKFKSIIIENCHLEMNLISLLPLSRNCERLILLGDEKQGSPFVYFAGRNDLNVSFLKQSLLQRILFNKLVNPIIFSEQYRITNCNSSSGKNGSRTNSPMILQGGTIIGNNIRGSNLDEYPNKVYYNNELVQGVSTKKFVNSSVQKKKASEKSQMSRSNSFLNLQRLKNMVDHKNGNGSLKRSPSMRTPTMVSGEAFSPIRSPSLRNFRSPSSLRSSVIMNSSDALIEGFANGNNTNDGVDGIFPNENLDIVFYEMKNNARYKTEEIKYHKKMNNIENFFVNKKTYYNLEECYRVVEVIKRLTDPGLEMSSNGTGADFEDIGIITLFAGQRVALAQILNRELGNNNSKNSGKKQINFGKLNSSKNEFLFENHDLNENEMYCNENILKQKLQIGTFKSFANVEKKYIIVSTVISSENETMMRNAVAELRDGLGTMHDMNELLDSIVTRCEKGLIILGDTDALHHIDEPETGGQESRVFGNYLRYLEDYGCIVKDI